MNSETLPEHMEGRSSMYGRRSCWSREVEQHQRPSADAVEMVLKASVGKAIKEIGDLDVG
jgi:hypothetical protein